MPVVRAEGIVELIADIIVQCPATAGGAVTGDLQIVLENASVTSRTFDNLGAKSEALLLINEPSVPILGTNAFQGKIAGANSILFHAVTLRPASGTQTMRITNVRINVSQLNPGSSPVAVKARIQMNASVPVPLQGPEQIVAFAQSSVAVQQGIATPGPDATTQAVAVTFTETFPTAFKPAIASGQDPSQVGVTYNSESGFVNSAQLGAIGRADTATRLRSTVSHIPGGVCVYASVSQSSGLGAQLVSSFPVTLFGGIPYQSLGCSIPSATAIWEVQSPNPAAIDSSTLTLLFQNAGAQIAQIQIASSLAPVTQLQFSPGISSPIPRFIDNTVPTPVVNLHVTSMVSNLNGPSSVQSFGIQAIPGGSAGLTDSLLLDSNIDAPNVVARTILPPGLTLAPGTCSGAPPGSTWTCDPDGRGLTILYPVLTAHTSLSFGFQVNVDPVILAGRQSAVLQVTTTASSDLPLFDPNSATSTVSVTVESSGCSASIVNPASTQIPITGGTLSFSTTSCAPWTASVDQLWLQLLTGPVFDSSAATVTVQAPPNPGPPRSANLTIADRTVIVTQAGKGLFVHDFAGTGRSGALTYDPATGTTYAAISNGDGTYKYVYNLFTSGFDILRTGDFNGDGKADIVVYNSHTSLAYVGLGNGDGTFNFQSLFWSPGYNIVEPGDLNGDGKTDFALYNSSTGTMYTAISNGAGGFTYKYTLITSGYTYVRLADFTGDNKADIFLYNSTTGLAYLGVGDGLGGFTFHPLSISSGYTLADIGELNGDGKADVILYNTNGNTATGISDGLGGFTFTPLLFTPGYTSVRLADYTGDGKADLTLYNRNNAAAYFGTGDGTGNFMFQSLFWSPGYDWVEPEDINGDAKMDIILYNSATGTEYSGLSNGAGAFTYTYQLWGSGKVLFR